MSKVYFPAVLAAIGVMLWVIAFVGWGIFWLFDIPPGHLAWLLIAGVVCMIPGAAAPHMPGYEWSFERDEDDTIDQRPS